MAKYGSVSCGVTAPFSWVLGCTRFYLCPPGSWSVSPVLCNFWRLCGGVKGNLLQEGLSHIQVCCTQSLCPCGRPLLTCTSAGDTQTLKGRSGLVSVGSPGTQKILSESSKHLWQVWGLILNAISCLLPSCWGFSSALGPGVSFNGGIQHSPVNDCSAAGCNFGVLAGEDEHRSFYSTILKPEQHSVVDVTCDGSKVPCYKEQYCIGTWNVRSTNQGKLEVVKQEMARVYIDILRIGELK